jgi:hypothetical protein
MQSLINIIRGTGAKNVIQVPGIQYANTMDKFLTYLPTDPLHNLMAVVDVYPFGQACSTESCYQESYLPVIERMPFMGGEIGPGNATPIDPACTSDAGATAGVDCLMGWLDQHHSGYAAWAWDTWAGLIANYADGGAASPWGTDYCAHIRSVTGQ